MPRTSNSSIAYELQQISNDIGVSSEKCFPTPPTSVAQCMQIQNIFLIGTPSIFFPQLARCWSTRSLKKLLQKKLAENMRAIPRPKLRQAGLTFIANDPGRPLGLRGQMRGRLVNPPESAPLLSEHKSRKQTMAT